MPATSDRAIGEGPGIWTGTSADMPPTASLHALCKAAGDFVAAALLMVLAAPVMMMAMAAVRLTSRGPAIYRQTRVGKGGRNFTIYKIRTMVRDSEAGTGARWSSVGDPRVTPVGRFLRATHLDELPQLWNVLRGEMSLVGPRPERPEFVAQLERALPGYRDRLRMRPGVTGLAQVQLPPDVDLESVRRKLVCDLGYVRRPSLGLDLRIIIATGIGVLGVPGSPACRLLRIPCLEELEGSPACLDLTHRDKAFSPCQADVVLG